MRKEEIKEVVEKGGLLCSAVCEILGAPKDHVEETMNLLVEKAKEIKDATILEQEIMPAVEQENGKLFSTFVEMEILFKTKEALIGFCFDFMPSSIEVIEPENIMMENNVFSSWLNELQGRLHQLDMIAKEKRAEATVLGKTRLSILRYNMLSHLIDEPLTRNELLRRIGIDQKGFDGVVEILIKKKEIVAEKDKLKLSSGITFQSYAKNEPQESG